MAKLPTVPTTLLTALLLVCLAAARAWGEPVLAVRDLRFAGVLNRVEIAQWRGAPAVIVLARARGVVQPDTRPPPLLSAVRLSGGRLRVEERWELPRAVRWVEPLRLSRESGAWLALIGTGWYLGREVGRELRWRLLCRCETIFSAGKGLLPFNARFAYDLDGDGRSEVLLPHWRGLLAYRLGEGGDALEPLWRIPWRVRERYEIRDSRLKVSMEVPRYVLRDANGDGVLDFILIGADHLSVAYHPPPAASGGGTYFVHDHEKLPELRRLGLPASMVAALERMPPEGFSSAGAFLAALEAAARDKGGDDWTPHTEALLDAVREATPAYFPKRVSLPGLTKPDKKGKHEILAVRDMNGDGTPDLIHVKTTGKGRILDQKNQLRWYEGTRLNGRLAFPTKPKVFFSEGPAFAELVWPRRGGESTPVLALATTEVGLMAIIRAFTFNEVTLDLFIYPWRDGALVVPPPVGGSLDFEISGNGKKNRPKVVLADLDGDGKREYLFNLKVDSLTAFPGGSAGPDFDANPLVELELPLPDSKKTIFVEDLDGDGREEIVLWYKRGGNPIKLRRTLRVLQLAEQAR